MPTIPTTGSAGRLSGRIAGTQRGRAVNELAPTVEVVSEQPYANRHSRRHARDGNGAIVNIPRGRRQQALNEPYRRTGSTR
jgi:hypothetical protein